MAGVSSAWATTKDVVETYDFSAWGQAHMTRSDGTDATNNGYATMGTTSAGFQVNSVDMNQLHITSNKNSDSWDLGNRFAVSANTTFRWGKGGADVPRLGNENASGIRYISIVGLKAGDRIVLTLSNDNSLKFYSSNATYVVESTPTSVVGETTTVSNGTVYTVTGTGWQRLDLMVPSSSWGAITRVVITRSVEVEEVKSWPFKTLTWEKGTGFGTSTIIIHTYDCTYATGDLDGLALQGGSATSWVVNSSSGLTEGNGNRDVVVLDLKKQDVVEVVTSGTTTISSEYNATSINSTYTGTCTFGVKEDGAFGFTNPQNGQIFSITVYREKEPIFADGDYYLKNKATGAYFAAGKNWNTQAITNDLGHYVTLNIQPNGKYFIDTHISGSSHFLTQYLWVDNTADEFAFAETGDGYYTISYGDNKVTAAASGELLSLTSGTGDNTKWKLLTPSEWKAENVARLDAATSSSGVDATFYITAPNFNRNDDSNSAWQGSPAIAGKDGENCNWNAEKFTNPYATFDVYQELTGLKPGAYKLTMQGFYRNGLDNASDANDNLAILYANSTETPLVNINKYGYTDNTHSAEGFTTDKSGYYVPNSQSDAGLAFNAGNFENELFVVVGDDGALRLGVKKTAATGADHDWAVFDNFLLTYYGTTVSKTITAAGWSTYCSPYALDLANVTGTLTDAYIVTGGAAGVLSKTSVKDGTVAANTGLLLKGSGEITIPVVASGTDHSASNKLVGVTASETLTANSGYVLMTSPSLAFYKNNKDFTLSANSAYLPADFDGSSAPVFLLFSGSETTGINAVQGSVFTVNGEYYNLNGQRVAQPTKGLYIVNGKKVVVK